MFRLPVTRMASASRVFLRSSSATYTPLYTTFRHTTTTTSTYTSTSSLHPTSATQSTITTPKSQQAVQEAVDASKQSTTDTIKVHPRAESTPNVETVCVVKSKPSIDTGDDYTYPHPIWAVEYANKGVACTHRQPTDWIDDSAHKAIQLIRFNFDWISGFSLFKHTPKIWLNRVCFLETIAGIPGSIGGTLRHLASLRRMRRDNGWIHTLIEEAENERMHLLTFIEMRKPGPIFKSAVFISQGIFFNFFWVMYLISPRFCHRLVGYLEEEATKTYTKMLAEIDTVGSPIHHWTTEKAPQVAKVYWKLGDDATVRDVIVQIRADEAHHRDVNHTFGDLAQTQASPNPFRPGH